LFVTGCVRFAGDAAGLRAWAAEIKLPKIPAPGQAALLNGSAGQVFDGSNPTGKFLLVSRDDGGCFVLAQAVDLATLPTEAEAALRGAALNLLPAGQWDDPEQAEIHHVTYQAALGARSWTLVLSYGRGGGPAGATGQAMLSATAR